MCLCWTIYIGKRVHFGFSKIEEIHVQLMRATERARGSERERENARDRKWCKHWCISFIRTHTHTHTHLPVHLFYCVMKFNWISPLKTKITLTQLCMVHEKWMENGFLRTDAGTHAHGAFGSSGEQHHHHRIKWCGVGRWYFRVVVTFACTTIILFIVKRPARHFKTAFLNSL